jgi:hypothetical protein
MDTSIIAIVIASSALVSSILNHVKHSECWCFKFETRTPNNTQPTTPTQTISKPINYQSLTSQ